MHIRLLSSAGLFLILSCPVRSQDSLYLNHDTIYLHKGDIFVYGRDRWKTDRDTIVTIPSETHYKLIENPESQSENFFDTLEIRASRRKWTNQLHNIVVTAPRKESIDDTIQTSQSILPYLEFGGKIIRQITIRRLDPFGPTVFDTVAKKLNASEQLGNKIHITTREKIISNYLLFSEGDHLDPSVISDNERIIRKLSYIQDVRILVIEIPDNPDYVDILVVTKDAFSIGLGGAITSVDVGNISLFESNLAGLGHEIHTSFHWNGDKDPWYGKEIYYFINNIGSSFTNSKIRYTQIYDRETMEASLNRPFLTPGTKYAGALRFEGTSRIANINYFDTLVVPTRVNYFIIDAWAGRSFSLNSPERYDPDRINLIIASRVQKKNNFRRPEPTENTFYYYHNKTLWLSSLSLSRQIFFKSNLIYNYGRTEDIPHGFLLNFTLGPEFGEFSRRFYTGMSLSWGGLIYNQGYMYIKGEFGGFSNKLKYPDQGVLHLQTNYYSNLFIINRFKLRQFINLDYTKGINRFVDESISIEDRHGIHGYLEDIAEGKRRAFANYEVVAFSPYYFYGFRFTFFGFADLGLISDSESILNSRLHSGFGLGVRIKNERLTFETIQLRIGYYPSLPSSEFPLRFALSGETRLHPDDFYASKPDIIGFE